LREAQDAYEHPRSASCASPTMKNAFRYTAYALCALSFLAGAHIASASFVVVSQGQNNILATTTCPGGICQPIKIGTGYFGTTTGAFVRLDDSSTGSLVGTTFLTFEGFDDASYTSIVQDGCNFNAASSTPAAPFTNTQVELNAVPVTPTDCVLVSSRYYAILPLGGGAAGTVKFYGGDFQISPQGFQAGVVAGNTPTYIYPLVYFALVTGGFTISPPDYNSIATSTCDVLNLTGCFQNALLWAFYPPAGAFDGFAALADTIRNKPPMGYFNAATSQLSGIGTSTGVVTLAAISGITDTIFAPLDVALAALWWAIVGFWFFFNRARHIQI